MSAVIVAGGRVVGSSGSVFASGASNPFAPNLNLSLTPTQLFDRQWNPTDSSLGTLPPSGNSGTDQYHCSWSPGSPNETPVINTPASLTSTIGAAIPALPDGNPTCMAIFYPSGFPSAVAPFQIQYVGGTVLATRMYSACWVLMPSNFVSNGNNIKWINIQNDNGLGGTANHIDMLNSFNNVAGSSNDGRMAGFVTQGGGGTNNYGANGTNASGALAALTIPPQGSGTGWWHSMLGQWVCLEWFHQAESNPGVSADGIYMSWVNGTLINSWANITYNSVAGPYGFNLWSFIPLYGGGGSAAPGNEYLCIGRTAVYTS